MAGQSESGLCDCQEKLTNPPDIDDNGLKCLASNGKPCHFPFEYKGKVTKKIEFEDG